MVSREKGLFPGMLGLKWRMCTLQTSFFHSTPALLQCTHSDLRERLALFHSCLFWVLQLHLRLSSSSGFSVLEALIGLSCTRSLPHWKDRAVCLSHHFQLVLSFTSSPKAQCVTRPHCYHALICNLNPKWRIFFISKLHSFPHKTPR